MAGMFVFLSVVFQAEPVQLFAVGRIDGKPDELALAGQEPWRRFGETFPGKVIFRVGKDTPSRSFPVIHPGPMDAWAGSKRHTFTVEFSLERAPRGPCLLVVGLCRAHYEYPPTFTASFREGPSFTFRTRQDGRIDRKYALLGPGALKPGRNVLSITTQSGSWFWYDGIKLVAYGPGEVPERIEKLEPEDTIFFTGQGPSLRQVVRIRVQGIWNGKGTFRIALPEGAVSIAAEKARLTGDTYEVPIPPVREKKTVSMELRTESGATARATCTVRPHRLWRIYIAMKTHYDIGYTEPVEAMLSRTSGSMLKRVYSFCDETAHFSAGHCFVWTYPTWLIEEIFRRQDRRGKERFASYLKRNAIVWNAMPFSLHTYFCGMEDMIRAVYGCKELNRRFGKNVAWAKQTDVPGHSRFLPQVLARSGIRLLQIGANNGVRGLRAPLLFWWEAPDGSRVLTQLTAGYGWPWSVKLLTALEQNPGYPYDAFLALYVTGDNVGPGNLITVARDAEQLSKRYTWPKIQIGNVEDYADWMERNWRDQIPVLRTELADWWIHGIASQARTTAQARWAREALPWSEKATSCAVLAGLMKEEDYPAGTFRRAYIQSLLYSEHTWGIAGFKPKPRPAAENDLATNPGYEAMKKSWELKASYATRACKLAQTTLARALERFGRAAAPKGGGCLVFNFLSYRRTGIVRVPLSAYPGIRAFRALEGGKEQPVQQVEGHWVFLAPQVPACGYRVFVPVRGSPAPVVRKKGSMIENRFYRVVVNEAGEVTSLLWKKLRRELLDPKAPFPLNQFIYEGYGKIGKAGWHGSPYSGKGTGKVVPATTRWYLEEGPVLSRLVVIGTLKLPHFPVQIGEIEQVRRVITLYREVDVVECAVSLRRKTETAVVEAGHVCFPFRVPEGRFKLELLGSVADPVSDIQEAGNRDTFAVQRWVDVSEADFGVTWATCEAPLVSLGQIRIFSWDPAYVPEHSYIYSSVFNNGWSTNFCEFQGGDFHFHYAFRAHEGSRPQPTFGWEVTNPLVARPVAKGTGSLPVAESFFQFEPPSVVLINVKRSEQGDGWILRLFESTGRRTTATVHLGVGKKWNARVVRLTEEDPPGGGKSLSVAEGKIVSALGPFEVQTILLTGGGR